MRYKAGFVFVFAVALLLLVFTGYYLLFGGTVQDVSTKQSTDDRSSTTTQELNEELTVVYDSNGFSPKEIHVPLRGTVLFDNQTGIPLWPASDPHPDHTIYPEFDAGRITEEHARPGEDFTFQFDKPGVWKYHNHSAPEHTAIINVH